MNRTIVTITGASGVGKSTLEGRLMAHFGGGRIIAHTSRNPRPGEAKMNYVFCPRWKLRFWMQINTFWKTNYLWVKSAHGNLYAAHVSQFYRALSQTGSVAFGCISDGYHQVVADRFEPEGIICKGIHLLHPGDEELRRRLEDRKEDKETIERRLATSRLVEELALKNPRLHLIEPGSPEQVFKAVIEIVGTK